MALGCKRAVDVVLAAAMLVALLPLVLVTALMLAFMDTGMIERRTRLGRNGRLLVLTRFQALPASLPGRCLERAGAREVPVLLAVLRGRLSFVGPRLTEPGTEYTGPRRLMAPGLIGPGPGLDDQYVEEWTLLRDLRLLVGRAPAHQSVSNSSS